MARKTEIALYLSFLISGAFTLIVFAPLIGQRIGVISGELAGGLSMLLWAIAIPLVIISYPVAALLSIYCLIRLQIGVKVRILIFLLLLLVVGAASDRAQSFFLVLAGAIPIIGLPIIWLGDLKEQDGETGGQGVKAI